MAITRWRPFRDMVSLQNEMNRLFDDFFARPLIRPEWTEGVWSPSVDVSETKDDVKICVQDNVITLKGEKKQVKEKKDTNHHRIERSYGSFCRSFTLPKTEEVKPKEIPISLEQKVPGGGIFAPPLIWKKE